MRHFIYLGILSALAASTASAETYRPHTLDAQMQNMQERQAAPVYQYKSANADPYYRGASPSAGGSVQAFGSNAIPALPLEIRTVGDVRYISGGVGDEEEAQLEAVKNDYNFRLLLTGLGGAYLSGAQVRIMDGDRVILSLDDVGPYLYATLPPGKYKVEVTAPEGGIKAADVTVPSSGFVKPVLRFTA